MAALDLPGVLQQIENKVKSETSEGHPYEAQQYVQSFVARKKKALGQGSTSTVVFHAAQQLAVCNASSSAGALLKWFIEDGAGVDNGFKLGLNAGATKAPEYCDVQKTIELLTSLSSKQAHPIVENIYTVLHVVVAKTKATKSNEFIKRMDKFEAVCAKVYEDSGDWYYAFRCYIRLNMIKESANVLELWSNKGFPSEKAMFFARGVMFLLAEGKTAQAGELLEQSQAFVVDNISENTTSEAGGPDSAPMAAWHITTILTELALMPPAPRVEKNKLFGLLYKQYAPFLERLDKKLLDVFTKTGEVVFQYDPNPKGSGASGAGGKSAGGVGGGAGKANPMAMLQGLMGAGAGGGAPPGVDMDAVVQMMNRMQAVQK